MVFLDFSFKSLAGDNSNYLSDIFSHICDPWDLTDFSIAAGCFTGLSNIL